MSALQSHGPDRLIRLLWRASLDPGVTRGRKRGLSVDELIATAIRIADRDGMAALTIRGLAAALGKPVMTLYSYVAGKAELIPLMLDTVYLQMERAEPSKTDWRRNVRTIANENRALFVRHPWAAEVSLARPALGPGTMAKYEFELAALEGLGVDDVTRDAALTHILVMVAALSRASARQDDDALSSGCSDEQWWADNAPLLELVFDAQKFPLAARIGAAAGEALGASYSADHAWNFAMDRLIDGLEGLRAG